MTMIDSFRAMVKMRADATIVSHVGCGDGIGSALLLRDLIPCAKVIFCGYDSKEQLELPVQPGVVMCDMTPPDSLAVGFRDAGAIVLDHHISQRALVESFGENGMYGDGICGTELAYQVWRQIWETDNRAFERFAHLCGVYDCWRRDSEHWHTACCLREALLLHRPNKLLDRGLGDIVNSIDAMISIGEEIYTGKLERSIKLAKECYCVDGVFFCQDSELGSVSHVASYLRGIGSDALMVAGWRYVTDGGMLRLSVSLRSVHPNIDVSVIAKSLGGGGHKGAAGFSIPFSIDHSNPISLILDRIAGIFSNRGHLKNGSVAR